MTRSGRDFRTRSIVHGRWLWLFGGLFAIRVAAQPAALVVDHPWLPRFESWHSGVLPYGALLASQAVILIAMAITSRRFTRGIAAGNQPLGALLLLSGGLYFGVMIVRLVLGLTVLSGSRWFASALPTVFHLVLASFLLTCGHFHYRAAGAHANDRDNRHGGPDR